MKLKIHFVTAILLLGTLVISSCDTFKDKETPENYSELPKNIEGDWQLISVSRNGTNITELMDFQRFHLFLGADNMYKLKNYLPFLVKKDGVWKVDDPTYPFHLIFKEEGTETDVITQIGFLIANGRRRLTIDLSPGCPGNRYVYTFEKIAE